MSGHLISMLQVNLPVLPLVVLLISSVLCAVFRSGKVAWAISFLATWVIFIIAIVIAYKVHKDGVISYHFGNWAPPVGIEYRIDALNSFVLLLITFIGAAVMPYAAKSVGAEIAKEKQSLFYCIFLLCIAGLAGITLTNDIFNIYVFLEISSLASYALISMGSGRKALMASFEYLVLGTIGATFFLIGIGILYMMTGTLNISDLATRIPSAADIRPVEAALAFIVLGLALKIAVFPMHIWLVNSYSYAPSAVSAFISSTATKVIIYVLVRTIYNVFGFGFSFEEFPLGWILIIFGVAGIIMGSLSAVYRRDVKRILAFSSIAQLGYVALGIGLASEMGLVAAIVHLANHALAKCILFLCVGAVFMRTGGVTIDAFKGVAKRMPATMSAFVIAGMSLIGIPGTAGFISKWYFVSALLEKGWWVLVLVILFSAAMSIIYIWRVIEAAYFQPGDKKLEKISEAPLSMLVPIWLLALLNIYFGIFTDITLGGATAAAKLIFGAI